MTSISNINVNNWEKYDQICCVSKKVQHEQILAMGYPLGD